MDKPPSKSSARELVEAAVEGAAGMVPIVGNPIAVAMAMAMGWSYNKRMNRWFEDVAEAVSELQRQAAEPLSFEELAEDEVFVDAVVHATRAAQATHQEAKLEALRNGVLNSIEPDAPPLDEQARFFRLVEQFGPAHLQLLNFLNDPAYWFESHGLERQEYMMGGRSTLLELGIPAFAGRRDWYDLLAGDLAAAGLAQPNLHVTMTGNGMWQPCTTPLGTRFLEFIGPPRRALTR